MKKISMNLLKVGIMLFIGLCALSIGKNVQAAELGPLYINFGVKTKVLDWSGEKDDKYGVGIYSYSVENPDSKTSTSGSGDGYKISAEGDSGVYWSTGDQLCNKLYINATKSGKYVITVKKAKDKLEKNIQSSNVVGTDTITVYVFSKDAREKPNTINKHYFINRASGDTASLGANASKVVYEVNGMQYGKTIMKPVDAGAGISIQNKVLHVTPGATLTLDYAGDGTKHFYYVWDGSQWMAFSVLHYELKFYDKTTGKEVNKVNGVYQLKKLTDYNVKVVETYGNNTTQTLTFDQMCTPNDYKIRAMIYDDTKINGISAQNTYPTKDNKFQSKENTESKVVKSLANNENYYIANYINGTFATGNIECDKFEYSLDWLNEIRYSQNHSSLGVSWIKIAAKVKIGDGEPTPSAPAPSSPAPSSQPTDTVPKYKNGDKVEVGHEIKMYRGSTWNVYPDKTCKTANKVIDITKNLVFEVTEVGANYARLSQAGKDIGFIKWYNTSGGAQNYFALASTVGSTAPSAPSGQTGQANQEESKFSFSGIFEIVKKILATIIDMIKKVIPAVVPVAQSIVSGIMN